MSGANIIIGIDFGTTYSGVSWALSTGAKDVRIINDWPNPHGSVGNNDKVPSVIAYDAEGKVSKWGYNVGLNDTNIFHWMKIMLDQSHKYYNETPRIHEMVIRMQRMGKRAEDVVTDYLTCLWEYTIDHLKRKKGSDVRELYSLKVVLTVPAVWSAVAKDKTLRAAKRAGMPVGSQLVTEPEAAALALLKQKTKEESVGVGDGLVVCDAGGGTVDLISYKVESLKPLKIRECVIGDGDLCGSVFLDLAFEQHIRTLVGRDVYAKIKAKEIKKMFREFEFGIKRSFTQDDKAPLSVDLNGAGHSPEIGIEDDTIKIETNTLRAIFDFICDKTQALVEKQLQGIKKKGMNAKAIALVGGFGESKYLHNYLKTANIRDQVRVLQEPGAISAVCRGATLWGLEQNHATSFLSRIARTSYGICFAVPFDPKNPNHYQEDKWWDEAKRIWRAKNQMRWLLTRGDEVVEGRVLKGATYHALVLKDTDTGDWSSTETLWYSDSAIPPARRVDPAVKKLCSVAYSIPYKDIRKAPTYMSGGKIWRDIFYSRDILCGGANLEFSVTYNNRMLRSVDVEYVNDY
ncbi:hypothetical protein EV426DRAFT_630019 [Tirmania nivea]|nr:hypothetical protein EV426DRAFT_630019 [Tirmania nivea]